MKGMRTPLLAAVVVLLAATMVGCPALFDGREPVGEPEQYLQLEIAPAPGARAIEVTEYEVTSLVVQVNDPDGQLIHTIVWEAGEGRARHLLPVTRRGAYELVVTHIGEMDGQTVEVTESAVFTIRASVITVVRVVPGSVAVVEVDPGEEPEALDLTGWWEVFFTVDGEEVPAPGLLYIHQEGSTLTTQVGMTGTIIGTSITLAGEVDNEGVIMYVSIEGTASNDEISAWATGDFIVGPVRMIRYVVPPGLFEMSGTVDGVPISVDTTNAYVEGSWQYSHHRCSFWTAIGNLTLDWGSSGTHVGVLVVGSEGTDEAGTVEVWLWAHDTYYAATSGEVVIDSYDASGMTGSFDLSFGDGSRLYGGFDVTFGTCEGTTWIEGYWQGMHFPYSEWDSPCADREVWVGSGFAVHFVDGAVSGWLWIGMDAPLGVGVVPGEQWSGSLEIGPLGGESTSFELNEAGTGTLTITHFEEGQRIAGSFVGLDGELIGSFDVGFIDW